MLIIKKLDLSIMNFFSWKNCLAYGEQDAKKKFTATDCDIPFLGGSLKSKTIKVNSSISNIISKRNRSKRREWYLIRLSNEPIINAIYDHDGE